MFTATIQATEEAIINALFAGETMEGINGNKVYGLPKERVAQIMKNYFHPIVIKKINELHFESMDTNSQIENSSLINEDLAPIPQEKRKWGTWNYAAFGSV